MANIKRNSADITEWVKWNKNPSGNRSKPILWRSGSDRRRISSLPFNYLGCILDNNLVMRCSLACFQTFWISAHLWFVRSFIKGWFCAEWLADSASWRKSAEVKLHQKGDDAFQPVYPQRASKINNRWVRSMRLQELKVSMRTWWISISVCQLEMTLTGWCF